MTKYKTESNSSNEALQNEYAHICTRLRQVYQILLEASKQLKSRGQDEDKIVNTSALNAKKELTKKHI